jgi:hypothetical protein
VMQLSNLELVRNASRFAFENRSSVKGRGGSLRQKTERNALANDIIEATECLKAWWALRPYPTAGRLVWSDAEGFNSLSAVRYSTSFNSHPFVRTTEPSIVEEP